jgi:hypothetical protein
VNRMIFPIPDTCFFLNLLLATGTYHADAIESHKKLLNRSKFERYVVLKSVELEIINALFKFNEVLDSVLKEMKATGKAFKAMSIVYSAKIEEAYYHHRDMFELLRLWIPHEEISNSSFSASRPEDIAFLADKMKSAILSDFSTRIANGGMYYRPEPEILDLANKSLDLSRLSDGDKTNVLGAYCFANHRHDPHKDHQYMFLTHDRELTRYLANYTMLGKLSIVPLSMFMRMNDVPNTPDKLLIGRDL